MKRFITLFSALAMSLALAAPAAAEQRTPYQDAITGLGDAGVIPAVSQEQLDVFRPLTRLEAAVLISDAFNLAELQPQELADRPDLVKRTAYAGALESINEAFMVSAAKDTIGSPAHGAVEAVINAQLMSIDGTAFNPEGPMTGHEFVTLLAKAFYGPEKPVDHAYQAVRDGWIDARFDHDDYITRGEAALAVYNIIGREDYESVTLFVTSDIHGHLIPYMPAGSA
ncbi:MAG: hypothetical protein LBS19_08535, partial [Clostridiales bacterium]|nr:hypothetical protein [Clostridiales bacterium]